MITCSAVLVSSSTTSSFFNNIDEREKDQQKTRRQLLAAANTVASISAAALAVKEANPSYEERCFKGKILWYQKQCWYCDPEQCAATKNYEDLTLINGDCAAEACNGFNEDESWGAYDFGCGLERNWCMAGGSVYTSIGWFSTTVTTCRAELTRSADNCNCASTNSVWPEVWDKTVERLTDIGCGCGVTSCPPPSPSPPPSPPPPSPFPPPPSPSPPPPSPSPPPPPTRRRD